MEYLKKFSLFDSTLYFYPLSYFEKNIIEFSNSLNPKITIIIPVYNEVLYTLNCLKSLSINIDYKNVEIIIINDNSTDETLKFLNKIKGIKIITNIENQGFLKNINIGIKEAKSEYVLILNNDVLVFPNFLESLLDVFDNKESVGAVGSMLIYENLELQEAGCEIDNLGNAKNIGRTENPNTPEYNYLKKVDYCSGCSLLFKKYLPNNEIIQLDEYFLPAYYEETDMCLNLKYNFKLNTYYQPLSKIIHFESISYSKENSDKKNKLIQTNKIKFLSKWKEKLVKSSDSLENQIFIFENTTNFDTDIVYDKIITLKNENKNIIYLTDSYKINSFHVKLQQSEIPVLYNYIRNDGKKITLKRNIKNNKSKTNSLIFVKKNGISFYYILKISLFNLKIRFNFL